MVQNRREKQEIREFMAKNPGISYLTALKIIRGIKAEKSLPDRPR